MNSLISLYQKIKWITTLLDNKELSTDRRRTLTNTGRRLFNSYTSLINFEGEILEELKSEGLNFNHSYTFEDIEKHKKQSAELKKLLY